MNLLCLVICVTLIIFEFHSEICLKICTNCPRRQKINVVTHGRIEQWVNWILICTLDAIFSLYIIRVQYISITAQIFEFHSKTFLSLVNRFMWILCSQILEVQVGKKINTIDLRSTKSLRPVKIYLVCPCFPYQHKILNQYSMSSRSHSIHVNPLLFVH